MKSISMNTDEQVVLHTTECILFDWKIVTGMPCYFNVELRQQQTTNLHCTCVYFKLVTVDDLANIVVFNYNPQKDKNEFSLI